MYYIIAFFLSGVTSIVAEVFEKKKIKVIFILLSSVSILIVSILGGVRDYGIGTDMTVYGNPIFMNSLKYHNFSDFYNYSHGVFKVEIGYMFLNFLSSRISVDPAIFYFICSLTTQLFIFLSIVNLKNYLSISFSWNTYLFIYYGYTFNLIRQSLAIAFFLFSFSLLIRKKKYSAITMLFISSLFHYSALIIGIVLLIIFISLKKSRNKTLVFKVIISSGLIVFLFFKPLMQLLLSKGVIASRYAIYFTKDTSGTGLSILSLLLKVPIILIFLWLYNGYIKKNPLFLFYFVIVIFDFIFYQMRTTSLVFSRISFYFYIFQIVSVPSILKNVKIKFDRNLVLISYYVYLVIVWYYQTVIVGINEIYPYSSEILLNWFNK